MHQVSQFLVSNSATNNLQKAEATAKIIDDLRQKTDERKARALASLDQLQNFILSCPFYITTFQTISSAKVTTNCQFKLSKLFSLQNMNDDEWEDVASEMYALEIEVNKS